ncbi:MAG: VTT domain-containing protein [Polyangiaceae bacterium]|nr:VTT domain-containing protein [Polyangiaceae bacterium]
MRPDLRSLGKRARGVALLAVVVLLPLAALKSPRFRDLLVELMVELRARGLAGVPWFYCAQTAAALLAMPTWLMNGIAGYVYGLSAGLVIAAVGVTLASTCAFFAGRGIFRVLPRPEFTETRAGRAIERLVARDGLKITLLVRATPVMPQNLLHFVFGTTALKPWQHAVATGVGMLPMNAVHVYVGSLVKSATDLAADKQDKPLGALVFMGLASVVAIALVSRVAKRSLARAIAEEEAVDGGPPP